MTTYTYGPLDYSKAEIRLLKLWPAPEPSDPIRISLVNFTLPRSRLHTTLESDLEALELSSEDPKDDIEEFIALSYVWGSPNDPGEVFVYSAQKGANAISITRNLDVALRNARMKDGYLLMWIDAICIDQGNIEERSQQVSLMSSIYTCGKVVIWLGHDADNSDLAIDILAYLGSRVKRKDDGTIERHPKAPPRKPGEAIWESLDEEMPLDEEDLRALVSFFERPWFGRLWIRQEVALTGVAYIQCRHTTLHWRPFQDAASCLCSKPLKKSLPFELRGRMARIRPTIENICDVKLFSYRYGTLRDENRGVCFTDPRDMIYGIGSLLSTTDAKLGVQPDYGLQTADVYMDVCVRILERQNLTYFLNTCELSSISVPNLPTWVPDWSRPMTAQYLLSTPWSASGFIAANARYLGEHRALRVGGIQVDEIDAVWDLYDKEHDEPVKNIQALVNALWNCYPGESSMDIPYDATQTMAEAYCRTFARDLFRDSWYPPNLDRPTFDVVKENLKKIWSLGEDWTGYDALLADPSFNEFVNSCAPCFGRCFFTTKQGYMGLAPLGAQPGDIVSVILGCDLPVVLRNDTAPGTEPQVNRWKVVGTCYANGLMSGEAIYGNLPSHYRAVNYSQRSDVEESGQVGGAILDTRTNDLKTDPAAVLEEFGIQSSVLGRDPYRLEVSESALWEAGVELRNFFLV